MAQQPAWRNYEEVARHLLNEMAAHFGLGRVEGKQILPGASGTDWEIDAKGVSRDNEAFFVIECRRLTRQGVHQEQMAALAFRIQDTGAAGGILVSPLPPQSGAQIIAASEGIQIVTLRPDSTNTDFLIEFLGRAIHGVSAHVSASSSVTVDAQVIRASQSHNPHE